VTATEPPDEEPTPRDGCRLLDEVELVDADADEEVVAVFVACEADADVPGIVAALTAANTPTAASEPAAAPTVRRSSIRKAASRERTRARVAFVISMGPSLKEGAKSYLRGG